MTLTPYDTGAVLEPKTWVSSTSGLTRDNEDSFGRVDFEDDGGITIITGLRVVPNGDGNGVTIEVNSMDPVRILPIDGTTVTIADEED